MTLVRGSQDYQVLLQTLYHYHELFVPEAVLQGIAWVIKNRAEKNRPEWGGYTIAGVCQKFACWNDGRVSIPMYNLAIKNSIERWLPEVFLKPDPTRRAVMFNNPVVAGKEPWTSEYIRSKKIGQFYFYTERSSTAIAEAHIARRLRRQNSISNN